MYAALPTLYKARNLPLNQPVWAICIDHPAHPHAAMPWMPTSTT